MSLASRKPVIAVVGGGFSGAAFALHLVRHYRTTAEIVVFEPRERLGTGLAYSTPDNAHRINVPAERMSLYPDQPDSFLTFVLSKQEHAFDSDLYAPDGSPYPRRRLFGDYVASEIGPLLASGAVQHRRASVIAINRLMDRWQIFDTMDKRLLADVVVIAATHPSAGLPAPLLPVKGHPKLVTEVTSSASLSAIDSDDRVLIIGNGLTSADVVASLSARGHRGTIVSISRRGLRSRGHPQTAQEPFGDFTTSPSSKASDLIARIRAAVHAAQEGGQSWHAVIDAVRSQAFATWQALDPPARRRVVRHARPFWDAHRFRIAPQVEKILDQAVSDGRMTTMAASLKTVQPRAQGFRVALDQRHYGDVVLDVNAIVVTTGPDHGRVLQSQPFFKELADTGILQACETGLGIACDQNSNALDAAGHPVDNLFVLGPLARGTFGELMGLPQVTEHALFVARKVAQHLALPELPEIANQHATFQTIHEPSSSRLGAVAK